MKSWPPVMTFRTKVKLVETMPRWFRFENVVNNSWTEFY